MKSVLALVAAAAVSFVSLRVAAAGDQSKWYECKSSSECAITDGACFNPTGVNEKFKSQYSDYVRIKNVKRSSVLNIRDRRTTWLPSARIANVQSKARKSWRAKPSLVGSER